MVFALPEEIDAWSRDYSAIRRASPEGLGYREMFTNALDAILVVDDERRFLAANDAACQLLGYPRAAILGMRFHDLFVSGPTTLDDIWQRLVVEGQYSEVVVFRTRTGTARVEYRVKANYIPERHFVIVRAADEGIG
jgi:PAS domain S-box-containing protein